MEGCILVFACAPSISKPARCSCVWKLNCLSRKRLLTRNVFTHLFLKCRWGKRTLRSQYPPRLVTDPRFVPMSQLGHCFVRLYGEVWCSEMNQPFLWFCFCFFSLLITAQTEAACRKRGRADKNEEGQPFYAFAEQICRITHAYSTCLKRQCSISFVCFGLGVSFLLFFLNQSCHVLGLEVWWLKWPMSSVREAPPIKAKANGSLGAVSLKGSLHPLHFPTPMSQTFHSLVVAVAHPHRTALRSTHWVNFLICQFVDPARTTF